MEQLHPLVVAMGIKFRIVRPPPALLQDPPQRPPNKSQVVSFSLVLLMANMVPSQGLPSGLWICLGFGKALSGAMMRWGSNGNASGCLSSSLHRREETARWIALLKPSRFGTRNLQVILDTLPALQGGHRIQCELSSW
ncbi:hypothetical protein H920_18951 [Fukomys damarensis]|uniref:Uncharacterized protein n=1 Tax=Fukomys damarensis TaxID=885580 RepID=A0A091CQR1_FUKDA|nr:hypothetical protein H920_18951 [Fukomys damarensis]